MEKAVLLTSHKPDYRIYVQGFGKVTLSEEQLLKWARAKSAGDEVEN